MRILVADDELTSLMIIQELLKKENCETIAARNGEEALAVLSSPEAPKIAILDWVMPMMDGIKVCRKIHELKLDQPPYIIMLTSKDKKDDMAKALDAGADDYIIKPCDPIELRSRLNVGKRSIALRGKVERQNKDLQKLIMEKQHLLNELKEDLIIAGSVQKKLLPKSIPEDTGLDIAARSIPCNQMGGDMYDVQKLDNDTTALLIFDVAGHGVTSALIAALAKHHFTKMIDTESSPGKILSLLNDEIFEVTPSALYLTAFLLTYNKNSHELKYCGAGHISQMFYNAEADKVIQLRSDGLPIGMMPKQKYEDSITTLKPDDSITLFTDGFTETFNSKEEMFGKAGMENAVKEFHCLHSAEIMESLIAKINDFRGSSENKDDLCILNLKR